MKAHALAFWIALTACISLLPGHGADLSSASEEQLIQIVDGGGSLAAKDAACGRLRQIGTGKSIPALAKLLSHPELSHSARYALTPMVDASAGEALLQAAGQTSGILQAGLFVSLGERRQANAVSLLSSNLANSNGLVADTAARALGQVGNQAALRELSAFLPSAGGALRRTVLDSILACSDHLVEKGEFTQAQPILKQLVSSEFPEDVRMAAHRGLIRAAGPRAGEELILALGDSSGPAQAAALSLIPVLKAPGLAQALSQELGKLSPELEAAVIGGLGQLGDSAAASALASRVASENAGVRLAALTALGSVGTAESVSVLLPVAAGRDSAEAAAARLALAQLSAPGVDAALLDQLRQAPGAQKAEAARSLAERGDRGAIPALLGFAASDQPSADAALDALATLVAPENLPRFVEVVSKSTTRKRAAAAAGALQRALIRWHAAGERVDATSLALAAKDGKGPARLALLEICGALPSPQIAEAFRAGISDADQAVRTAAILGMCETVDPALIPDLVTMALGQERDALRDSAARAVARLATEEAPAGASLEWKAEPLLQMLSSSDLRLEQRRIVLAGLASVPTPAALNAAEGALAAPETVNEASRALIRLAKSVPDAAAASRALKRVAQSSASAEVKSAAAPVLTELIGRAAYITTWEISGPYRQDGKNYSELFEIPFAPEQEGGAVTWRKPKATPDAAQPFVIDLLKEWPGEQCVAYARTTVDSPREQKAVVDMGSDDGLKVWLNGKLVHANNTARPIQPGTDKAKVTLAPGKNVILVKLTQNNMGWAFCLRLLAEDGGLLEQVSHASR